MANRKKVTIRYVELIISYIRPRPSRGLKVVTMRYALYVILGTLGMNRLSSFWINQVESACFICLTFFSRGPMRFSTVVDTGFPADS